jgi:hypothetical protein
LREQILFLDPHDDYHSARDKIGWTQADRVLLVWPVRRRMRKLTRQLDLLLLQRHAARLGAAIALVTDDPVVCDHAEGLSIPVFDSVDDSHLHPWRARRPAKPVRPERSLPDPEDALPLVTIHWPQWLKSKRLARVLGGLMFALAIGGLTVMAALTLPGARLTLTPQSQTLTTTVSITADPARTEIDVAGGAIPAKTSSVVIEGSGEASTTGSVDEATQKAGGLVTFTNLTTQAVRIPAGTAVRTTTGGAPIRFVVQRDVTLEAKRSAKADAPVLAVAAGPAGNVGAGLINSIEGPLAVQAAVTNSAALSGGEVKQVAAVTDADRKRLREQVLTQLRQQGYAELLTRLRESEFAPLGTVQVIRVLAETYDHFAGEKAERLKLDMRVEIGVTVVDAAQAFAVGESRLRSQLGDTLLLVPGSLAITKSEVMQIDEAESVTFEVIASAQARATIDADRVRELSRWQPTDQVSDVLYAEFPIDAKPEVTIWPGWFGRLPWLAWRVEVEIGPAP